MDPASPQRPSVATRSAERGGGLVVVVIGADLFATHELPAAGVVVIGRSSGCDIAIDHASVSRRHAVLSVGPPLALEDAGSVNGTRVGAVPLRPGQRLEVSPGHRIELGSVQIVIQHRRAVRVATEPDAMAEVRRLAARVARGTISVLIQGETGVGKEVMAEAIHAMSPRAAGPFLRLNCAALSPALIESELFGHEGGAFTGAVATKPGLLETAHRGTVFLDEIGELPRAVQAKLLRVVEDGQVLPVGGVRARTIDVRFISATNRDLATEVERGAFRADLLMRLDGVTLQIPPLRARRGELRSLARLLLSRASRDAGRAAPVLSGDTAELLRSYDWPGNIRELKHVMERAIAVCTGDVITPADLPERLSGRPRTAVAVAAARGDELDFTKDSRERERRELITALTTAEGNQSRAAQILGISRRTLLNRLDRHALPRPRKRT